MEYFEEIKNKFAPRGYNWAWLDGNCHPEFLRAFKIPQKKLSSLLYYSKKRNKFQVLEGNFEIESMDQFIENLNKKAK